MLGYSDMWRVGMSQDAMRMGKRGTVVLPARLRKKFGLDEGSMLIAEEKPEGILVRPAALLPLETYTPERKAEFILSNAVDEEDYALALRVVEKLWVNPSA
jgi:AbrB family looped-hinge helix DNA binding protein